MQVKAGCLILFAAIFTVSLAAGNYEKTDDAECNTWTAVMVAMQLVDKFNIHCHHNDLCTGFDCNGSFAFPIGEGIGFSNVAFGFDFLPCNTPQQLEFHVTTDQSISEKITLSSKLTETKITVPIRQDTSELVEITLIMVHQLFNDTTVSLEINSTVSMGGSSRMFSIMPRLTVRVPQCIMSTDFENETYTDIVCMVNSVHQCGNNQMCVKLTSMLSVGRCACVHGLVWNSHLKECEIPKAKSASLSSSNILVAALSIALGVMLIAVVVALVVKYRRYQQRYGQHELLINNQDGEGDSSMLQA